MLSRRELIKGTLATPFAIAPNKAFGTQSLKIGAILPFSGGQELIGNQAKLGIDLAITEINAAGGVLGSPIEVVYQDDQTDPKTAVERAITLIQRETVAAIVGPILSPARDANLAIHRRHKVALLYGASFEGGSCDQYLFNFGTSPNQELDALLTELQSQAGNDFYLFGADIAWGQKLFPKAEKVITEHGGTVVAKELTALNTTDFTTSIRRIRESGAKVVIQAFPGSRGLSFLKQAEDLGLFGKVTFACVGFSESSLGAFGPGQGEDIWVETPFVSTLDQPAIRDFVSRAKSGSPSGFVTRYVVSHYNAIKAVAAAASGKKSSAREDILAGLSGLEIDSPTGQLTVDPVNHCVNQSMFLAKTEKGSLRVVKSVGNIRADAGCALL